MSKVVKCIYYEDCLSRGTPGKCAKCDNNRMRNFAMDYFKEANDAPIPDECPRLTYDGPAEQTAGYKCPVCGQHTNPYAMEDSLCSHCGYKLNTGV